MDPPVSKGESKCLGCGSLLSVSLRRKQYIPNMDLVNLALIMEREMQATPFSLNNSSESDSNMVQSNPGKIKREKKNKGVNWYTHLPKGPPPKMTPEQQEKSMATKNQLRNFITKRIIDKPMPSTMFSFPNLNLLPMPRLYQFHQTVVPPAYADVPSPSSSPNITHVIPFSSPDDSKSDSFPLSDSNFNPLHIFHGKGEIAKAVDYRTCDPNCWCGPPSKK